MELVYLWVKELWDVFNMEISFSKDFEFKWVGNQLQISKTQNVLPLNFFSPNIVSVNAIVGRNGSGKSAALKYISRFLGNVRTNSVFAIIAPDKKLTVYINTELDIDIEVSNLYEIKRLGDYKFNKSIYDINQLPKIYYSQTFDIVASWAGVGYKDISTAYLLSRFVNENKHKQIANLYDSFLFSELLEQIKLANDENPYGFKFKDKLKKIGFYHDFRVGTSTNEILEYVKDWRIIQTLQSELARYHSDSALGRIVITNVTIGKVVLLLIIINEELRNGQSNEVDENWVPISAIIQLEDLKEENLIGPFLGLANNNIEDIINIKGYEFLNKNPSAVLIKYILNDLNEDNLKITTSTYLKVLLEHQLELMQFDLEISVAEKYLQLSERTELSLYTRNKENWSGTTLFKYNWYLSTGELAEFSLFSRFVKSYRDSEDNWNNSAYVWICLDEAETSYNPEWQRKLVDNFISYLPLVFPNKKIQLFLATHSPIILSDIPKCNIAFLKSADSSKQEKNIIHETFGANIHTLYSKGFFLDSLIGEFAKNKIQLIIDRLKNQEEQDIEDLQKHIDLIGEPILKNQLQKMLNEKQPENLAELEKRKAEIEAKIKRLKGGNDD